MISVKLQMGDALLIIDAQNDFLPGGALAVTEGDAVIPPINRIASAFAKHGLPIFATRDWHPADHSSFKIHGGIWPVHCVAGTQGADFAPNLRLPDSTRIISKADEDADAYSGFEGTNLGGKMKSLGVKRVFASGLATDYCVLNSVLDSLKLGFETYLLTDAVRAVNVKPVDGEEALNKMSKEGAILITSDEIA
jgi:nicotinamidase/pyrazinamidase